MRRHMILQVAAVFECSVANATFVRSIFTVRFLVNVEASPMIEGSAADVALEGFFTCVLQ